METPLNERRAEILRAIVGHYVRSGEPVGSKNLVERYNLSVSPATVRNEMAALEEAGLIYQPHTSAGRIPTDAGYRVFVDTSKRSRLPERETRRIRSFFVEPRWELEDALRHTAALLSSLTDHAAVVFAPALARSLVRHVELVELPGHRAMVVMVTDTGRVENHVVAIPESSADDPQLDLTGEMLNRILEGVPLDEAVPKMLTGLERLPLELRDLAAGVAEALEQGFSEKESARVFLEGTSNIVDESKFSDLETVRQVVGALEHRRLLLEVLADALSLGRMSVRIGSENSASEMQFCSVITAPYGDDEPIGSLGVVGPTRMDYRRTIAAVREVSASLGRMLSSLGT
jgi:heat-inducible transcriptional repressor